jgi:hypothetical protein
MAEKFTSLEKMKNRVRRILTENFEARDDDKLLYYLVCKEYCEEQGYNVDDIPYRVVMFEKKCRIPNYETVGRCRRKLQEEDKSLWGNRRQERMEAQEAFVEFARN